MFICFRLVGAGYVEFNREIFMVMGGKVREINEIQNPSLSEVWKVF